VATHSLRFRALCVVVALIASACGAADAAPRIDAALPQEAETTTTAADRQTTTTTTTTTVPETTTTLAPDPHRTVVLRARADTPHLVAYDAPGGLPIALPFPVSNPHQFGGPLTLMVTEGEIGDDWLKVQLPIRPNGQEAWVPAIDYVFAQTRIRAEVDLTNTSVKIFDGDKLLTESQAAIGTSRTPTPFGTFFVAAKRRNPPAEAHLGTWAIVLSGYSEVLETFSGGLPVIAIHGSNNPSRVIGRAISNGCVRVPNDVVQFIADNVPLGAPVHVSA
jgi:lipoprotein-anchoring transpeptidase ErfK/SrfK